MKILGIESSGLVASIAVMEDDNLLGEYTMNHKKTHSQTLLPMLDELVKMIELDLKTIDAIAVSKGPGSFTGLRIGSATAKGLGLALEKPIIPVETIDAMAYNLWGVSQQRKEGRCPVQAVHDHRRILPGIAKCFCKGTHRNTGQLQHRIADRRNVVIPCAAFGFLRQGNKGTFQHRPVYRRSRNHIHIGMCRQTFDQQAMILLGLEGRLYLHIRKQLLIDPVRAGCHCIDNMHVNSPVPQKSPHEPSPCSQWYRGESSPERQRPWLCNPRKAQH